MAQEVVNGATLTCSFGVAPSALTVIPVNRVNVGGQPAANIMDHKPMVNIMPFGVCSSLAFPATASATSAASGVLTPMPCVPATTTPWAPGAPTVMLGGAPALNNTSTCACMWAGVITISVAGQVTTNIP